MVVTCKVPRRRLTLTHRFHLISMGHFHRVPCKKKFDDIMHKIYSKKCDHKGKLYLLFIYYT